MLSEEIIEKVKSKDLEALAELDRRGLIIAKDESVECFAERLVSLQEKLTDLKEQTQTKSDYEIEGMKFKSQQLIPKSDFKASQDITNELYQFENDWVPGFYQNPKPSWLFGGCCYTSEPEFFSFFQIREKFKTQDRWLFYKREELLSHEMCHVARSGFNAKKFEEFFAYKTATKKLRQVLGSTLYSSFDTYFILIAAIMLPVLQVVTVANDILIPLHYFLYAFLGVLVGYAIRWQRIKRVYSKALKNMTAVFSDNAQAVLFRCDDAEIADIANWKLESAKGNVDDLQKESIHWQVICHRFAGE